MAKVIFSEAIAIFVKYFKLIYLIFLWKWWWFFFRIVWWIESLKEQHLFEIIFNINIFPVTFVQFNPSLLIQSIHFLLTPNFWMVVYLFINTYWWSTHFSTDKCKNMQTKKATQCAVYLVDFCLFLTVMLLFMFQFWLWKHEYQDRSHVTIYVLKQLVHNPINIYELRLLHFMTS